MPPPLGSIAINMSVPVRRFHVIPGKSMICCGKERSTRFCPDCGKALKTGGLWDLLAYIRMTTKKHASRAQTSLESSRGATDENSRQRWHEDYEAFTGSAKKWANWADQLNELLSDKN